MPTKKKKKQKKKSLDWEYCECGCHGHELEIGGQYFWLFDDLEGSFYLRNGHKYGGISLGTFKSFEAASDHVRSILKDSLKEIKKVL